METETVTGEKKNDNKPNVLAIIGGALLLISFFFPWIEWVRPIPGFKLLSAADSDSVKLLFAFTWLIPIGGLLNAFLGYTKNRYSSTASLVVGLAGLAILVWFYLTLSHELMGRFKSAGPEDTLRVLGLGVYIAVVGCITSLGAAARKVR